MIFVHPRLILRDDTAVSIVAVAGQAARADTLCQFISFIIAVTLCSVNGTASVLLFEQAAYVPVLTVGIGDADAIFRDYLLDATMRL